MPFHTVAHFWGLYLSKSDFLLQIDVKPSCCKCTQGNPRFSIIYFELLWTDRKTPWSNKVHLCYKVDFDCTCSCFHFHENRAHCVLKNQTLTFYSFPFMKVMPVQQSLVIKKRSHRSKAFPSHLQCFWGPSENPIGAVILYWSCYIAFQLPAKGALSLCLGFMAANWQGDKLHIAQGSALMMS